MDLAVDKDRLGIGTTDCNESLIKRGIHYGNLWAIGESNHEAHRQGILYRLYKGTTSNDSFAPINGQVTTRRKTLTVFKSTIVNQNGEIVGTEIAQTSTTISQKVATPKQERGKALIDEHTGRIESKVLDKVHIDIFRMSNTAGKEAATLIGLKYTLLNHEVAGNLPQGCASIVVLKNRPFNRDLIGRTLRPRASNHDGRRRRCAVQDVVFYNTIVHGKPRGLRLAGVQINGHASSPRRIVGETATIQGERIALLSVNSASLVPRASIQTTGKTVQVQIFQRQGSAFGQVE